MAAAMDVLRALLLLLAAFALQAASAGANLRRRRRQSVGQWRGGTGTATGSHSAPPVHSSSGSQWHGGEPFGAARPVGDNGGLGAFPHYGGGGAGAGSGAFADYAGGSFAGGRRVTAGPHGRTAGRLANGGGAQAQWPSSHWCYYCASPRRHAGSQRYAAALDQLFELRMTAYPHEAVHEYCHRPINFTALPRQQCRHNACYSITFGDRLKGEHALTVRGCAEHFLAVPLRSSDGGGHVSSCRRLPSAHDLPNRECVCVGHSWCTGAVRSYGGADAYGAGDASRAGDTLHRVTAVATVLYVLGALLLR